MDKAGNIFFADTGQNVVLRLDVKTGILTLVAGNGTRGSTGDSGLATKAQLNFGPNSLGITGVGIAVDAADNVYIADTVNQRVRKVSNGVITTVAGNGIAGFNGDNGLATNAQLYYPEGIALDASGNLYIADSSDQRIRKVMNGVITTVAGNGTGGSGGDGGPATSAQLGQPNGVAIDSSGNLYIAEGGSRIRKVTNGVISIFAGNGTRGYGGDGGPATSAKFDGISGIAADSADNLYIADSFNNRIRRISNGIVTTVVGNGTAGFTTDDGSATSAQLSLGYDVGLGVDLSGNLYFTDGGRVRKVANGVVSTIAGGGSRPGDTDGVPALSAQLSTSSLAVDTADNVYFAEGQRVRKISTGIITTAAGKGSAGYSEAATDQFNAFNIAVDARGDLYIADTLDNRIRKISNGVVTTVAGNGQAGFDGDGGVATGARVNGPMGIAVDQTGSLFITAPSRNRIRKVSDGIISTIAGNGTLGFSGDDGPATAAAMNIPSDVAVDRAGNVFIADSYNSRIRKVSNGIITTVAGGGSGGIRDEAGPALSAALSNPFNIAVDSAGSVYISDATTDRLRKLTNGILTTIAGGGSFFNQLPFGDDGPATNAQLKTPRGIAVDSRGNVYVADSGNNRIRVLKPLLPTITAGGVVPINSSISIVQSGSWASIYGDNLASGTFTWNGDFPTTLGGVRVLIDNRPAYLWLVSPTQINFQVPDNIATGPVSVVVSTIAGSFTSTVTIAPVGPSFSLFDNRHAAAAIATPDGSGAYGGGSYDLLGVAGAFAFKTRAVKPGEALILYGTGFGPTNPSVPAGKIFSGAAPTINPVTISIGGVKASVAFAGITQAGLYQINVTVPEVAGGDQTLQASVNGVQTPAGPVVNVR